MFDTIAAVFWFALELLVGLALNVPGYVAQGVMILCRWFFYGVVFFFANILGILITYNLLIIGCDFAQVLCALLKASSCSSSLRGYLSCCISWAIVVSAISYMLMAILSQPAVVVFIEVTLAAEMYVKAMGTCFGLRSGDASFLSCRLHKAVSDWSYLSQMQKQENQTENIYQSVALFVGLVIYAVTYREELAKSPVGSCLFFLFMVMVLSLAFTSDPAQGHHSRSPLSFIAFVAKLSLPPVHAEEVHDCDIHRECSICLGPLCTSAQRIAGNISRRQQRFKASLSACRIKRSWAGFSGARSPALQDSGDPCSGIWGAIATLPCGHEFHIGCIDSAAKTRLQCPTCRGSLGEPWSIIDPEEKHFLKVGAALIGVYQVLLLLLGRGSWGVEDRLEEWIRF